MSHEELRVPRLLDDARDAGTPRAGGRDALRAALHDSLADDPSTARLAAIEAAIANEIATMPAPSGDDSGARSGSHAPGSQVPLAIKLGALVLPLAMGVWMALSPGREVVSSPVRSAPADSPALQPARARIEPSVATARPFDAEPAASSVETAPARVPGLSRKGALRDVREHHDELRIEGSELELLREAQRVMRQAPLRSLQLTEAHRSAFAQGQLAQEREVLAIEALLALGRLDEAKQRASTFMAERAGSPLTGRVRRMLDKHGRAGTVQGAAARTEHLGAPERRGR